MILLTGTPFSGLEIAADQLIQQGLFTLPNADPADFFISPDVKQINNTILADNKLTPFDFNSTSKINLTHAHKYVISRLIKANSTIDFLVDPRFCATSQAWNKPADADFFVCFRHPAETSALLYDFYGLTITQSLEVWRNHYQPFASSCATFCEFTSDIVDEDVLDNFACCCSFLEIDFHREKLDRLLQNRKPFICDSIPVPRPIFKLYDLLKARTDE